MATKAKAKSGRELKPVSYRQLQNSSLTFELKTGRDNNLVVFDEESQITRAIKHCPNQKSIFVDEQSGMAVVKPIVFVNGVFHTEPRDVITQDFLALHPGLGRTFEVIDDEADTQDMLEYEDIILDIKSAIRNKSKEEGGIEEIRVVVGALISDVGQAANMSPSELRYAAYEQAETNPNRFLNDEGEIAIFDDASITRQAISQQGFLSGVISLSPDARSVIWSDNKAVICSIPAGKSYTKYFAEYLGTEDGIAVMKELSKR